MAFLPKRLQSKFDSKLYDSKPQLNPTETLDAIEQALRFYTTLVPSRDIVADTEPCCGPMDGAEFGNRARNGLTHLATLKQQVADLVAFREAHEWRPISDEYKDGRPCLLTNDNWAGYAVAVGQYKPSDEEFIDAGLRLQHVYPPNLCMPLPTPPAAEGGQGGG